MNPLTWNSLAQEPRYEWFINGIGSSMFNPNRVKAGVQQITYKNTFGNKRPVSGCERLFTINVGISNRLAPQVMISGKCSPVEVVFNIPKAMMVQAIWEFWWWFGHRAEPDGEPLYKTTGSYTATLSYRSKACPSELVLVQPVVVEQAPQADFSVPGRDSYPARKCSFTNQSSNLPSNKYIWKIESVPERGMEWTWPTVW